MPDASFAAIVAVALCVLTTACQKVPLLAPSGSSITLTSPTTVLPLNGTATITAQVIEPSGTPPHSGTLVNFSTSLGSILPAEAETDLSGRVTVQFVAGTTSGQATIIAASGGTAVAAASALKIAVGAAAVGRVALSANPGVVPASGGTSTISASVLDLNGNPLASVPVAFSTTAGSLSAAVVSTDQNGTAQAALTTSRQATVTATAGIQGSTGTGTGTTTTTTSPSTATITVNVNAASTITVGGPSPTTPTVGQAVTFSVSYVQNENGSPVQRVVVDFGDGSAAQTIPGQPSAVTHVYNQIGTFTVRVTAVDTFGDTTSGTDTVTVVARPQPTVSITPTVQPAGQPTSFAVTVTPTSGVPIQSERIDFGDGSPTQSLGTASAVTVQHAYQTPGTYTVTVIVSDVNGGNGSVSTFIVVPARAGVGVAIAASPSPGIVQAPVTFTATLTPSTASIDRYEWSFGDGSEPRSIASSSTTHVYTQPNVYTVTVTAVGTDGSRSTSSIEFQVKNP